MWGFALAEALTWWIYWPLLILLGGIDLIFLTRSAYCFLAAYDEPRYRERASIGSFVWWTVVAFLLLYIFGLFNVIGYVKASPMAALGWVGWYFVGGMVYMIIRGINALLKAKDRKIEELRRDREQYMREQRRGNAELDEATADAAWRKTVKDRGLDKPIQVKDHKGRITAWVFLWLPDLAYQVVFRFVDRLADIWNFVWRLIRGALQAAANTIWGDITKKL